VEGEEIEIKWMEYAENNEGQISTGSGVI